MIIIFGSINVDIIMPVSRFPDAGETILCDNYETYTGGKGANHAISAAHMGAKVAFVGCIGDDAFGRRSKHNLKTQGVLASGVGISEKPTGYGNIIVTEKGQSKVVVSSGANLDVASDQLPNEILRPENTLLLSMELNREETYDVISRASQNGTRVILNAAPACHIPNHILKKVDYLIVNKGEAKQMAVFYGVGDKKLSTVMVAISKKFDLTFIVTLGSKGAFATTKEGKKWRIAALSMDEILDTTGAGDAFCGIFASCLDRGMGFADALHYASVGGGLTCLSLGAQEGMPYKEDIDEKLEFLEKAQCLN